MCLCVCVCVCACVIICVCENNVELFQVSSLIGLRIFILIDEKTCIEPNFSLENLS